MRNPMEGETLLYIDRTGPRMALHVTGWPPSRETVLFFYGRTFRPPTDFEDRLIRQLADFDRVIELINCTTLTPTSMSSRDFVRALRQYADSLEAA